MYTSQKREHVNAFASRLLGVDSETLLPSAGSRMQGYRDWSNRFSNNKACRGRFSIVDSHGFESILRGAMEVECKPSSKHLVDEIKNKDDLLTLRSCARTFISGATMSIIESLVVLERLIPRGNQSVTSRANGRRASFVERRLRLVAAPRARSGCCSPASPPPEGTYILALESVHRSRWVACRRGSAAPPTMVCLLYTCIT